MNASSDIIIIGGGIIGLAIAVELRQQGAEVTVLSRDFAEAASHAAAGMLAPQAEQIPPGPLLDLCLRSRSLYPDWVSKLEALTELDVNHLPCGILSPVFELPSLLVSHTPNAHWLNQTEIHQFQPGLGSEVLGGWWYPDDGQVDNRRLVHALRQAAEILGITIQEGVTVQSWRETADRIDYLLTNKGKYRANTYVLTPGSWAKELMPLPVRPIKGQMLALRMPNQDPCRLKRVLFGPSTYLVPRKEGRLIIGATSEEVGWTPHNTPQGIQTLLERAIKLYPPLADWPIEDFWWGFRPGTPDEWPFLGASPWDNLMLATGHYRNGILLAPVTASLIADLIIHKTTDPLLTAFSRDRVFS
ncbi:MAG: glycine oxidase ThiO [Snowella sp.]|nr:glycine oxidase ThiO [Snowella sp.]